jgi:bis(5'-nucleosyl)-tetraphosphatase (symmetrical)
MATYAIGDVQGCYDALCRLLDEIRFDPARDRLWFAGDLVNRGPQSLEVLRFVMGLDERAVTVLGNHDLHLLAVAASEDRLKSHDTFSELLRAPDRQEVLTWLRHRPLLHHAREPGFTMVHAGFPPQWDLDLARSCASEVETVLRSADYPEFFRHMYGNRPDRWSPSLGGWERLRFITNCLTRLRFCDRQGRLALACKEAPGRQPRGYLPWFDVPGLASANLRIVFGHWAALGLHRQPGIYAMDGGCVWGGSLAALRLDPPDGYRSVPCPSVKGRPA